jgi:GT2 family glycosyltransferase
LKNVHLLEEKPYSVLPPYLHAFDVCIIPFKKTPLTEMTNPVKLFEFLSAGKAVVATDLMELRHYHHYVQLASTPAQWLLAIEKALHDHSPERVAAHTEFARHNTWDERVAQIKQHIHSLFAKASIIVVTYNNLDYTRLCLESIYKKTVYPNYEVIVVDNASIDGTVEFLKTFGTGHPNFASIFNEMNEGFASANNRGIAAATGEYIVFLNNDTIVTRGWLSGLINHLRHPQVGIVGPVTNFSGNESRIEVDYRSPDEMEGFAERYTRAHEGQTFEISMLALFCIAMRRSVIIDEVGLLDERFGIGMFEDDDYALRVKQKGYKVICAEDVFVHHWGRASFSKLSQEEYQRLFDENRRKFEEKWGMQWEPHRSRSGR